MFFIHSNNIYPIFGIIINKYYIDKKLEVKINYAYLGVDSEKYILVFNAKNGGFNTDNILTIEIIK